jgi:hypothetical protein
MKPDAIDWALRPITNSSLRHEDPTPTENDKKEEKEWGNKVLKKTKHTGNWTTLLGENLVKIVFEVRGYRVFKPPKRDHKAPDWETDEFVVEVKTSNWTISGTAGEKVLGVPYKYAKVPSLWKKPLIIVCVAYQEWELTYGNTQIFGTNVSLEQKMILDIWKRMNIHFVPLSKLVNGDIKDLTSYIRDEYSKVGGGQETTS